MPGIGVDFNPLSGANRRDPQALARLARALGGRGLLRSAPDPADLAGIAEEFRHRAVELVAICGGDGTTGATFGALLEAYRGAALPPVALLRGGSMNTVARALGVRRGPPDALLAQLARVLRERGGDALPRVERPVMRVRSLAQVAEGDEGSGVAPRVGFLFGAGVVCGFLAEYYATGAGPVAAARTLLRAVARSALGSGRDGPLGERFRGSVELASGIRWPEREYLALAAGTIDQIGLGFRPFWRCAESRAGFHLLGIHASPGRLVRELPRIRRGLPLRAGCAEEAVTARALLVPESGALRYMIDGDLLVGRGPLEVTLGPRIRFAVAPATRRRR